MFSRAFANWPLKPPKRALFALLSLLAGISSGGDSSAQSETLRVGLSTIPPSLGNPFTSIGHPSSDFWGALYDGLTEISESGEVAPALALTWKQVEPTRWTFTLRDDVVFHNGAPFNARAVVATIAYLQSPEGARYLIANEAQNIAGVNVISDHQVDIVTREPDAILPRRLSLIKLIEPQRWAELGAERYALEPVGTGPYAFVEWGAGNGSVTLRAVDNQRRPVKDVRTVILVKLPNGVSREQALLSGEIDVNGSISPDSVANMRAAGFDVQVHALSQVISVTLPNLGKASSPTRSKEVRQALNMAVDRQGIAQFIFGGLVEAASQGAMPGTVGFNPDLKPYPYDPDQARRLLAQAGYPNGFPLKIGVLQRDGDGQEDAYQKVVQDLGAIGVKAEVRGLQDAEFLRRFMSNEWGEYDAFSLLWNSEPMRDVGRALEYFSCLRPQPFFCDEELAAAIRDSRRESNPEKREQALRAIMSRARDLAPSIWLTNTALITATRKEVRNFLMRNSGMAFEAVQLQR